MKLIFNSLIFKIYFSLLISEIDEKSAKWVKIWLQDSTQSNRQLYKEIKLIKSIERLCNKSNI